MLLLCVIALNDHVFAQREGLLPVYSNPMVFLKQDGQVAFTLPKDHVVLNNEDGTPDRGWAMGMAGNSAFVGGFSGVKNENNGQVYLYNDKGQMKYVFGAENIRIFPYHHNRAIKHIKKTSQLGIDQNLYYIIDTTGIPILNTSGYSNASSFYEAYSTVFPHNGQRMVIDTAGKTVFEGVKTFDFRCFPPLSGMVKQCEVKSKISYLENFRFSFKNLKGEIAFDTDTVFPGRYIREMTDFNDDVAMVHFFHPQNLRSDSMAFVHKSGRVIGYYSGFYRVEPFRNGFAVLTLSKMEGTMNSPGECFLLDKENRKRRLPKNKGIGAQVAYRINDRYLFVLFHKIPEEIGFLSGLYDIQTDKYIDIPKGQIQGVKWNLVSMLDVNTKRYFVYDLESKKIVYDTNAENLTFTDIQKALEQKNEVRKFICRKASDLPYLSELKNLKHLEIYHLEVDQLPSDLSKLQLESIKLDELRNLKTLPELGKNLKRIAFRDIPEVINLDSFIRSQLSLKELYLINFGFDAWKEREIKSLYPNAKVVIEGRVTTGNEMLESVIPGF